MTRVFRAVAALRPDPWLVVLAAAVASLYLVPSSRVALVPLAVAGLVGLRRPALLLAVIPATFPFYDAAAPGAGLRLDRTALLVIVAAVAAVGHLLLVTLPAFLPALARPARLLAGEAWTRDEARTVPGDARVVLRRPEIGAAVALLLLGALSLLTVADVARRADSIRQFRVVIVLPALFFVVAVAVFTGTRHRHMPLASLQRAVDALAVGGVIVALIAFGQFALGAGLGVEGVRRVSAVFRHPNEVALYLGRVVPLTAAYAAFGPRGPRRTLYRAATLLMLGGVGLSFSRGGYLAVAAAVFVILLATGRRQWIIGFVAFVAGGAIAAAAWGAERFTSLLQPDSGSEGLRLYIWQSTAAMLRDHPVWGVGLDQFLTQYAPRYIAPAAWPERFTSHPHNLVLDFYVRLGVLGLAWLVFTVPPLIARGWQAAMHARAAGEPPRFALALGAVGVLVDFAVHGFVDQAYFLHMLAYTFWFAALTITAVGTGAEARVPASPAAVVAPRISAAPTPADAR